MEMSSFAAAFIKDYTAYWRGRVPAAYIMKASQFDAAAIEAALGEDLALFEPLLKLIEGSTEEAVMVLLEVIERCDSDLPELSDICTKLLARCATLIGPKRLAEMLAAE